MSSSVFKEVTSLDSESDKMNGNLVIVVKRDGSVSVDKQILQELLTSKEQPKTAVSVVRVTSPTPSIEEEINEEKMKKRELAKKQLEEEIESDIDEDEFEDALERKMRDLEQSGDENDAPHVSLCLENYYPPDQVKHFVANVLQQGGVQNPLSLIPVDYDLQRYTIQNDHCYTNLMLSNPRVNLVKLEPTASIEKLEKAEAKASRTKQNRMMPPDPDSGDESDFENDSGEFFDASDSDPTDISFSEDDDEDDLDFTVHDRFGNKKPTTKKLKHKHHRSLTKGITKSRNSNSFNAADNEITEVSQLDNNKEAVGVKKRFNKPPKKLLNVSAGSSGVVVNTGSIQIKPKPQFIIKTTPIDVVQNKPKLVVERKPQIVQQIVQRKIPGANEAGKVVMHPKIVVQRRDKFGEVNSLFSTPDVIKKIQPSSSGLQQSSMKEFLHLTPSNMKMNKQISVQTHSSVSELALEQDKNLEMLESIVKEDLNTPISVSQPMMHGNTAIPTIVKMLENPNDLMMGLMDQEGGSMNMDLNIDGLPEDLLQHVAELAENKEIQAIIDKQVLNVHNMSMGGGSMVDLSGISGSSQMMSPMNNVIVQEISRPTKINVVVPTPLSGKRDQGGIKVLRRDGSLLILPPVEAPTTRGAKRRAQTTTEVSPATSGTSTPLSKQAKLDRSATSSLKDPDSRNSSRRSSLAKSEKSTASGKNSRRQSVANSVNAAALDPEMDDLNSDGTWNSEDDPDRLWCICKTPHNNRFMICCDKCEEWFHGNCVNITKAMGREMEDQGIEWTCPSCKVKRNDRKSLSQQKLTKFFNKKLEDKDAAMGNIDKGLCVICQEKPARSDSIYCSDNCIRNHADKLPLSKSTPSQSTSSHGPTKNPIKANPGNILKDKNDKVAVYERGTNKILSMSHAPTTTQLAQWLLDHPSYEAVRPGSTQAQILTTKNKQSAQSKDDLFSNPAKITTGLVTGQKAGEPGRKIIIDSKKNIVIQQSPVKVIVKSGTKSTLNTPTVLQKAKPTGTPPIKISPGIKRQASADKHGSSERSDRPSKSKIDQERLNVRRTLKETLMQRMTEITNPSIQKMTAEECEQLALETEQEMYIFFNKDLSSKYKTKYRSLKFNLSDVKNITLIEKICCKTISPKQLVELQSAALASDELAKWRENESKHQLEIITKAELDALAQGKNLIVTTHKGEELLENKLAQEMGEVSTADIVSAQQNKEDHSPLQSPSSSGLQRDRFDNFINKSISLNLSGGSVGMSPLSSPSISSTTTKTSSDPKDRHYHSSSKSSKHKKHDRHKSSKDSKRSRERDDKKKHSREKSREKERKEPRSGSDRGESSKDLKVKIKTPIKIEEKPFNAADCNLIDKILGDQAKPKLSTQTSIKDEVPGKSEVKPFKMQLLVKKEEIMDFEPMNTDPIEEPKEIEIYNGSIYMADVARFPLTASLISGPAESIIKNLPDCLEVVGRINPSTVFDYISKLRNLPGKELVLIRFGSPDEEAYDSLFTYFFTRKRLGVIKAGIEGVKDLYIVPIEAKKPLPTVLLPIKGPGFIDGDHKPDLLIGVLVKGANDPKVRKMDPKKIPKPSVASKMADIINMVPGSLKQPSKSKLTLGLPKTEDIKFNLPLAKANDDDEPYSPEDSDDDSKTLASFVPTNTSADLEMQTIIQRIKESQEAIAILSSKGEPESSAPMELDLDEPYSPSRPVSPPTSSTADKSSIFENISLPSNIGEILASIKGKSTYGSNKMDMDDDTDEYVPTASNTNSYRATTTTYPNFMSNPPQIPMPAALLNSLLDVDERMYVAPSTSGESKLAKMSEDELLKMIPDEAVEPTNIEPEVSPKKSKWDIQCPPPPGLEDDFPA